VTRENRRGNILLQIPGEYLLSPGRYGCPDDRRPATPPIRCNARCRASALCGSHINQ